MATKIVTKNSSTASAVPAASDLVQGELAVNVVDKRLFTENNAGAIVELGTNPSTIDINAGTIDGVVIGGTTPAAITGSTVTSTGNIVVTGTVDGRDVATDGTKLDGIEAGADVTDTTNVTAAGALMDSEVTNLAQVKAFDSADYATAAQGTKVDGIEAGADVTDTANVTAAGALMDSELTSEASVKALNQGVATTDSPAFAGLTVDTDTLAVDSTNNRVGIGTASPTDALTIDGQIKMFGNDGQLKFNDGSAIKGGNNYGDIRIQTDRFRVYNEAGSNLAMNIDSSGKVGIGTTSPSQALTVNGTDARIYLTGANTDIDMDNSHSGQLSLDGNAYGFGIALNGDGAQLYTNSVSRDLIFGVNETEVMRVTNGNVGIACTNPDDGNLQIGDANSAFNIAIAGPRVKFGYDGSNAIVQGGLGKGVAFCVNNSALGSGEAMRVDSSGNLLVGGTTINAQGSFTVRPNQNNGSCIIQMNRANTTATSTVLAFYNNNSVVGTITHNNTGTAYNTSSDQRLKENIADADDAGSKIDAIQVRQYDWKADGSHQDYGVVAQELVEIAPEAVTVPADSEEMMGVDYSKLVPMLIKEIQSLRNRVAQLEE